MKKQSIFVMVSALAALLWVGCDETKYENRSPFDNGAYIDVAETTIAASVVFKKTITDLARQFKAKISYPAAQPIEVSFVVDPALVGYYNARFSTSYEVLDAAHYTLPEPRVTIPAGESVSNTVDIRFVKLDQLEIDATYLVPLTINTVSGGMNTLDGSKTIYYVVKRSSAITTAANLTDNYFSVPGFDTEQTGGVVDAMPAVTYEALIYVQDFAYGGPLNLTTAYISTIMGCEQHLLLRIGDSDFPIQQLQMQGPIGKFPEADKSKLLQQNTWYHVAMTWDIAAQTLIFYVNGKEQSRSESYGASEITSISLKNSKHGFFIGRSFNDNARQLCGNISEVRVWSVARTQQELWDAMYDVDPKSPGLAAYWKFDEVGNTVPDLTENGNDAIANKDVLWPEGIEIPQLNKEE